MNDLKTIIIVFAVLIGLILGWLFILAVNVNVLERKIEKAKEDKNAKDD